MKGKVLIVSEVFYPEIGSGANRMTNMTLKLKECGYKVDVITSIPKYPSKELYEDERFWNKEKEELLNEGSNIYRISPSKIKLTSNFFTRLYIYIFFVFKSLLKILFLKEKYDVVIVTEPSIFMGIVGIVSKWKFRCKFIFDIRDLWPECLKNVSIFKKSKFILNCSYLFESFIFRFTDALIINSEGFRSYILDKGYKKEIVFVPNGLSDEDRDKNKQIVLNTNKNKRFTVIYTGMLGLPQNVRSIVKVARNLRKYEDIDFKIIGTGIQKQRVLELINYYKLTNIKVMEAMPKDEALKEVAKAHIGLVHLRGDSAFDLVIPGKIIDYMGIGIPIVAGVEGYTSTIIKESNAGIVTKPDDHRAMAKAIEKLYFDDTLQSKYAKNGLEFSEYRFNWNYNIKKVDKLITRLIRGEEIEEEKNRSICLESFYE